MVIWVRVAGNKRSVSYSRRRKLTGQGRKEMLAKGHHIPRDRLNGNIAPDGQVTKCIDSKSRRYRACVSAAVVVTQVSKFGRTGRPYSPDVISPAVCKSDLGRLSSSPLCSS